MVNLTVILGSSSRIDFCGSLVVRRRGDSQKLRAKSRVFGSEQVVHKGLAIVVGRSYQVAVARGALGG